MRFKSLLLTTFSVLVLVVLTILANDFYLNMKMAAEGKVKEEGRSGMGLQVPGTENLNELVGATDFILAVRIEKDYEILEVRKVLPQEDLYYVDHHYQMTIEKIFKEHNENEYIPGDVLDLIVPTGIRQKKKGNHQEVLPLIDELPEFDDGEYLLFLSAMNYKNVDNAEISNFHYIDEKEVFQISNYYHIYKKAGANYINIVSDLIPELTDHDLENINTEPKVSLIKER